jgi:hypothetical protein
MGMVSLLLGFRTAAGRIGDIPAVLGKDAHARMVEEVESGVGL